MKKFTEAIATLSGAALLAGAAACGTTVAKSPPAPPHSSSSQPSSGPSNSSLTGPAGTTFEITGPNGPNGETTTYQVTLTQVLQQASGQASDNANVDAVAVGSNGQNYTSEFDEITAGTNFSNGDINVSPGQSLNGWVSFELPPGVSIASVQWHPGPGGEAATWTVGS